MNINEVVSFVKNNWGDIVAAYTAIVSALWITSEVLAQIPSVKANSVFQLIYNWLGKNKK